MRKPRSIAELKHREASEFRLSVLFSGLPCLREVAVFGEFHYDHHYLFNLCWCFETLIVCPWLFVAIQLY